MPKPNDGKHIDTVVSNTTCKKHKAESGVACWHIYVSSTQRLAPAVCGARVKRAGFKGTIDPASLSQKSSGGAGGRHRRGRS